MADAKRSLDIVVSARDEASATMAKIGAASRRLQAQVASTPEFQKFKDKIEKQQAASQGNDLFKNVLFGAGAVQSITAGVEGFGKLFDGLVKVEEGSGTAGQAIAGMVKHLAEGIPILGSWVHALDDLAKATNSWDAARARSRGEGDKGIDAALDDEQIIARHLELQKKQTDAFHDLTAARVALAQVSGTPEEAAATKALQDHSNALTTIRDKEAQFVKEHGGKVLNLTVEEAAIFRTFRQQELVETQRFNTETLHRQQDRNAQEVQNLLDHQTALQKIRTEGATHALDIAGLTGEGERARIENDRKAAIQKTFDDAHEQIRKQNLHSGSEEMNRIEEQAARRREEINNDANQKISQSEADEQDKREDVEFAHQQQLSLIRTSAQAASLRAMHQDAAAALLELRAAHDAEAKEDRRVIDERVKKLEAAGTDEARKEIDRIRGAGAESATAKQQQFEQQQALLKEQQSNEAANQRAQIEHNLMDLRIKSLREQAELGDKAAEQESGRLEKLLKYKDAEEDILRTLREQSNLTEGQRKELNDRLSEHRKNQAALEAGLTGNTGGSNPLQLATLQESPFLTGVQQASREAAQASHMMDRQLQAQVQTAKNTNEMAVAIKWLKDKFDQWFSGSTGKIIPFS